MVEPSRIHVQLTGDKAVVRILMRHEMESGQRHDAAGQVIPAWFIRRVVVTQNGRDVLSAGWGPSVAKNPFLRFTLKRAKPGDTVGVTWTDNRGESRSDQATIGR